MALFHQIHFGGDCGFWFDRAPLDWLNFRKTLSKRKPTVRFGRGRGGGSGTGSGCGTADVALSTRGKPKRMMRATLMSENCHRSVGHEYDY